MTRRVLSSGEPVVRALRDSVQRALDSDQDELEILPTSG